MPRLKPGTIVPTPEEDAAITAAAMSDPDALPVEHEQMHRQLVERLIGKGLDPAGLGDVVIDREGNEEPAAPVSTPEAPQRQAAGQQWDGAGQIGRVGQQDADLTDERHDARRDDHAGDLVEGAEPVAAAVELADIPRDDVQCTRGDAPEQGRVPAAGRDGEVEAQPQGDRNGQRPGHEVGEGLACAPDATGHEFPRSPHVPRGNSQVYGRLYSRDSSVW